MNKAVAVKLLLIFIILVGSGWLVYDIFLKDTEPEEGQVEEANLSENWTTYTNEEYGFSFKYPPMWGDVEEDTIEDSLYTPGFTDNANCGFGVTAASYWPTARAEDPDFGRLITIYDAQGFTYGDGGEPNLIHYFKDGPPSLQAVEGYIPIAGQGTSGIIDEEFNFFPNDPTVHVVFNTGHGEVTAINFFCSSTEENIILIRELASTFRLL